MTLPIRTGPLEDWSGSTAASWIGYVGPLGNRLGGQFPLPFTLRSE